MENSTTRLTAHKVKISDIINGEYIKKSGWEVSYVNTDKGNITRVNLIGTIVSVSGPGNFYIDDSTGCLPVRAFSDIDKKDDVITTGNVVLIIGMIRTYENELYIVPEIIKKLENIKWLEVRRLELGIAEKNEGSINEIKNKDVPIINSPPVEISPTIYAKTEKKDDIAKNPYEEILNAIRELDAGNGASIESVIEKTKIANSEKIIKTMIEEGEIFEIRPGKIKILE